MQLDPFRCSLHSVKTLRLGVGGLMGGKIITRIRLTSATVEVEAELGIKNFTNLRYCISKIDKICGNQKVHGMDQKTIVYLIRGRLPN